MTTSRLTKMKTHKIVIRDSQLIIKSIQALKMIYLHKCLNQRNKILLKHQIKDLLILNKRMIIDQKKKNQIFSYH
jgi:hypothetical protein